MPISAAIPQKLMREQSLTARVYVMYYLRRVILVKFFQEAFQSGEVHRKLLRS